MAYRNVLFLLLLRSAVALAQTAPQRTNLPFDEQHFSDADGLKHALQAIQQGDALYAKGGMDFPAAIARYEQALAFNPDNAELNTKIGLCHLNGPTPQKALPYFQQAFVLDPSTPRIHFLLGYSYQLNAKWDEAISEFQTQRGIVLRTPDPDRTYNMADKHISECKYGKAAMAAPAKATVTNLGPRINSDGPDYGALVTADGSRLMFTSRRAGSTGGKVNKRTNEYFEDIYFCDRTPTGWSDPVAAGAPVNTASNDASVGLFNDGRTMIIYRDEKGAGDLYESTRTGEAWSAPQPFNSAVNGPDHETSAWYSFDRQWLYFTSDREGGLGGSDIYRSKWDPTSSTWGTAENLGPTINTPFDEDGVFLAADGHTLYFGSQGHTSMGGFDLFKSTLSDGAWSKPENLGWPINSPGDDQFLVLTADGTTGFFSSTRAEGLGQDDLYRVDLAPTPRVDETAMLASAGGSVPMTDAKAASTMMLKGFIKNLRMMEGLEARIELMDVQDARPVASFTSDAKTGAFTVVVPGGHDYAMHVYANGYLMHSENLPAAADTAEQDLDIVMNPLEAGSSEVMRNIFFNKDKWALLPASIVELDGLVAQMQSEPTLRFEVGGHTDDELGPMDNQRLSEYRAQAVVDYLVGKGIAPDRLVAKGYGPSRPLVPNDSDAHRARNRRTEVRVL